MANVEVDVEVLEVSEEGIKITDGDTECWIPKSALKDIDEGYLSPEEAHVGASGTISISQKLAENKRLV